MKKTIGTLLGLSLFVSSLAFGANLGLSPTIISSPFLIKANSSRAIRFDVSKLSSTGLYNICCMICAEGRSGGVYASFITGSILKIPVKLNGKDVVINQNLVISEKEEPVTIEKIQAALITKHRFITIENRDGKHALIIRACSATPALDKKPSRI